MQDTANYTSECVPVTSTFVNVCFLRLALCVFFLSDKQVGLLREAVHQIEIDVTL